MLCYSFKLQFFASFIGRIRAGVTGVLVFPPSMHLTKSLLKMLKVVCNCSTKFILIDSKTQALKLFDGTNAHPDRRLPGLLAQAHGLRHGGRDERGAPRTLRVGCPALARPDAQREAV